MEISDQIPDFESNWLKYHNIIFRRVIYITGNIEAAEDITQEVFTKLYKSPPAHKNIEAWLKRVSTNLAYNFIRDEKSRTTKLEKFLQKIDMKAESAENIAVINIEYYMTKKILNKLKSKEKFCLLLKFSGYKYSEIANILNINKNSIGKTLSRAQEKFKKLYLKTDSLKGGGKK
jgi:RNA polymerase sigma factor (sigma-70 family)